MSSIDGDRISRLRPADLNLAVRVAILFSGIFLMVGLLTGTWKYWQIRRSPNAKAHHYVDVAHRSSLLYASSTMVLAVLAFFSSHSDSVNFGCVVANVLFFSLAIGAYIVHGFLGDTVNQFRKPHTVGKHLTLPSCLLTFFMVSLVVAEVGGTGLLLWGCARALFLDTAE